MASSTEPTVLFEDNHLLVVAKPSGMLSQGDRTGDLSVLDWGKAYIRDRYGKPGNVFLALVHRLDRPASGVMVLARTSKAAKRLSRAFRERMVEKHYWAVVEKPLDAPSGRLEHALVPGRGRTPTRVERTDHHRAQRAALRYRMVGESDWGVLVEVELETGRKHQIRAQLAAVGSPIIGDTRYGADRDPQPGAICLHARRLTVPHPIGGGPETFLAPVPTWWPTIP